MKAYIVLVLTVLIVVNSFGFTNTPANYLVSSTLIKSHSKKTLSALWKKHHIPKIALPVKYEVDIYEVIYKAPWIDSSTWINCSGISPHIYPPHTLLAVLFSECGAFSKVH